MPDAFADEISLWGRAERIAERLEAWKASPGPPPSSSAAATRAVLELMAELTA